MQSFKPALIVALLVCLGCASPGRSAPRTAKGYETSADQAVGRQTIEDVYSRSVIADDVRRQAEIDDLARASSVEYVRLFMDQRLFAIVTPRGPGLRGANGNGPFLIYEWTEKGWLFFHKFGGYEYEVEPDTGAPILIAVDRIDRDTIGRITEQWTGTRFEVMASTKCEYPGE